MDFQPALHSLVSPQVDHGYIRILRSSVMRFDTLAGTTHNPEHYNKNHNDKDNRRKSTKSKTTRSKKSSHHRRHSTIKRAQTSHETGVPILGASTSDENDNNRSTYLMPPSSRAPPGPPCYYSPDITTSVLDQRRLRQYRFTPGSISFKNAATSGDLPREHQSAERSNNQDQTPTLAQDVNTNTMQQSDIMSSQPRGVEAKEENNMNEQQQHIPSQSNNNNNNNNKTTTIPTGISPESLVTKLSHVTEHWSQTLDELGNAQREATVLSNRCHEQERLLAAYQSRNQAMAQDLQRESERVFEMEGVLLGLQRQVAGLASERQTRLLQQQSQERHNTGISSGEEVDVESAQKKTIQELRLANERLNEKVIQLMMDKALLQQKQQKMKCDTSDLNSDEGSTSNHDGSETPPFPPPPSLTQQYIKPDALLVQRVADLERLNGVLRRSIQLPERWRRASANEIMREDKNTNVHDDVVEEVAQPSTSAI